MTELTMPRLSDSMQEGTIVTWLKRDGDEVSVGEDPSRSKPTRRR
jgi:pyruvate dehydrogenase E2 component (dihydrolipoamide acetyltransferase)